MTLLKRLQKRPRGSRSGTKYWAKLLKEVPTASSAELQDYKREADKLGKFLHRFELAMAERLGGNPLTDLPVEAEWAYRAETFLLPMEPAGHAPLTNQTRLSDDVTAFTDDPEAQISLRQIANGSGQPFSLVLDITELGGSFFSLAIGLGEKAAQSFTKNDLVGVHIDADFEKPCTPLVRLNLRSGPNTEQIVREHVPDKPVEFDLFYLDFDTERMSDAWVDVMLPPQSASRITFRDLVVARRPRAEI